MFRSKVLRRMASLLTLGIVTAAGSLIVAAPARAASVSHTYFHFNMCGNKCNAGGLNVANDVINSIYNRNPQPFVVTLNEVCGNQYNHMYYSTQLGAYFGRFFVTVPGACANGTDYGIAIWVKTPSYAVVTEVWLPDPYNKEDRKLGCLKTSATGGGTQPLIACVTHIDPHDDTTTVQIRAVADTVRPHWTGNHVMVAGDFNATPKSSRMSPMYHSGYDIPGTGIFNEADSADLGRNTNGTTGTYNEDTQGWEKIDYIFLSKFDYTNYSGDATYAANSDHDPLWAVVTYV